MQCCPLGHHNQSVQKNASRIALYRADQVREIERAAIAAGIPAVQMMRRAADAGWQLIQRRWPEARRIHVLAGPGNNGGDGLWLAALARQAGRSVSIAEVTGGDRSDAANQAREQARCAGVDWVEATASLPVADLYVDALFGIGLARAPGGLAAQWIKALNGLAAPVLSLDVPSGLDADTGGAQGAVVRATVTLSFVAWKQGLFTGRARACCGELLLDGLAIPPDMMPHTEIVLLAPPPMAMRARDAHKGSFGHVLVIGGSTGFSGAAWLAGEAALRTGAGLVSLAIAPAGLPAAMAHRPELMVHCVGDASGLVVPLARASVLAVGPGLGQLAWSAGLLDAALAAGKPLVLDADALNLLARVPRTLPPECVITPHPGEAARLLGCTTETIEANRFAAAVDLAKHTGAVVVLKGAGTLVACGSGRIEVCSEGNPGMASGGTGDVLTGMIAALRAQGLAAWDAARLGVSLHARAGDRAAQAGGERGMIASDLLPHVRMLVNRTV